MAKKGNVKRKAPSHRKKPDEPKAILLSYRLDDLPTAQHKAGLAGLVLQIDSMRARQQAGALPDKMELPSVTAISNSKAEISLTRASLLALCDDLYAAQIVEARSKKKWPGKSKPRRIESFDVVDPKGVRRTEARYVYDVVQPLGPFLSRYTDGGKESWHKLWRDMVFAIPRNQDKTRAPYRDTALLNLGRKSPDEWDRASVARRKMDNEDKSFLHCRAGYQLWDEIKGANRETPHSELSGSLLLGVQNQSAERLPYIDHADHALLLHFWPLACRVFLPEQFVQDKKNRNWKTDFVGYVIAIPEVRDLKGFCVAYVKLLNELDSAKRRYRPRDAVISLPAQGSLEFMRQIDELAQRRALQGRSARYVTAVEFFHMIKVGNNAKMLAHGRVPPQDTLLAAYDGIRRSTRNLLFQSARLVSLLRGSPWFSGFETPFRLREWSFFVHNSNEPHRTPHAAVAFAFDADRHFKTLIENYRKKKETGMTQLDHTADSVDRIIYELVQKYVRTRACARAGVDEKAKDWWKRTAEQRREVASKLFLELRSRHGDDLVRHFSNTVCSVPQWLNQARFLAVADALMRDSTDQVGENRPRTRDDVKTLTLMALSAASRSLSQRGENDQKVTLQETDE
jgi:CRISPR-associated protein Cmx8